MVDVLTVRQLRAWQAYSKRPKVNPITASWSELAEESAKLTDDNVESYKQALSGYIGQTRTVPINGSYKNNTIQNDYVNLVGGEYQFKLIGVCHDTKSGGGHALLTFMASELFMSGKMYSKSWTNSSIRKNLANVVLPRLPGDLQSAICAVDKVTGNEQTSDKLWVPSGTEVRNDHPKPGSSGELYPVFDGGNDTRVIPPSDDFYYDRWWLRTSMNDSFFNYVGNDGVTYAMMDDSVSTCAAFCFCI